MKPRFRVGDVVGQRFFNGAPKLFPDTFVVYYVHTSGFAVDVLEDDDLPLRARTFVWQEATPVTPTFAGLVYRW